MGQDSAKTSRKPRADSIRNRERLLDAAARIFAEGGPQASLEAVAREAAVGIGTLYRHFPTREALFDAVYRHEVDQLGELAAQCVGKGDPVEALRQWLHACVRLAATKRGMISALQLVAHGSPDLKAYTFDRMAESVGTLLGPAVQSGALRGDVSPEDLLRTLFGIIYAQGPDGWHPSALRMVDVFVDGLRVR
jgi:AcrR family transcriptional regulator